MALAASTRLRVVGTLVVCAAVLIVFGWRRRSGRILGSGELVAGLMLLLTPEAFYLAQAAYNGGLFPADYGDLLGLGVIGLAGGFVAMLGLSTAWSRSPFPREPGGTLATPAGKR